MAKDYETMLVDLGFMSDESHTIVQTVTTRSFPRDAIVLQDPHGCELIYLILKGKVEACTIDSEEREATLATYTPGISTDSFQQITTPCQTVIFTGIVLTYQVGKTD